MMQQRSVIIWILGLSLAVTAAASGVMSVRKERPTQAYQSFAVGDLAAAKDSLHSLSFQQLALPFDLYRAYLEQAAGHFEQAEPLLYHVLETCSKDPRICVQVYLALAHAAYQTGHDTRIPEFVKQAKRTGEHHPGLSFFEGLATYIQGHYFETSKLWATYHAPSPQHHEDWLLAMIYRAYPPSWQQLHLAHCLLEQEEIKSAREILEKEQHCLSDTECSIHRLAASFLGLSYLQEASRLPLAERASYYQIASLYFQKGGAFSVSTREQQRIVFHLYQELCSLFHDSLAPLEYAWSLTLLQFLQQTQAVAEMDAIATLLAKHLLVAPPQTQHHAVAALRESLQGGAFLNFFAEHVLAALKAAIVHNTSLPFYDVWPILAPLYEESSICTLAQITHDHLLQSIYWDDDLLSHTHRLSALYVLFLPQKQHVETLSHDLLQKAYRLWQQMGQESRGKTLMDLALSLSAYRGELEQQVGLFLAELFTQAEANNLLSRLVCIYDALVHFQIPMHHMALLDNKKIANHMADALYLYEARHYQAAQDHAKWVLKLVPHHLCAQRLMGLTAFQLGQDQEAITWLESLPSPDLTVQQALAFARTHRAEAQDGHIAHIHHSDPINDDDEIALAP